MPSNPKQYPRWVTLPDGRQLIVPDHETHSSLTGQQYDENAQLVTDSPKPPGLPPPPVVDPLLAVFTGGGQE